MSWRDKFREDWLVEFDDDGVIAVQVNIKSDRYWPDSLKLDAAKRYVLYVEAEQKKEATGRCGSLALRCF